MADSNTSGMVEVRDDGLGKLPIVSIDTRFETVSDTDYLKYVLSATGITTDITVNLNVPVDAQSVVDSSRSELQSITLTSSDSSVTKFVRFNSGVANNSLVEVAVTSGTTYTINPLKPKISFRVVDGTSFISVSVVGLDPVGEGSDAKFRVSTDESDMSRSTALEVAVSVSEGDTNFISRTPPATPPATVSIPVGSRMATYSVPTTEDTSMNGTNGVITAVVEPGENYKRSATNGSGSVTVLDNGGLPVVSISSNAALPNGTGVTEGSTFDITISTVDNVSSDLDVMLNIPDGTLFGFNITGTNPIRIPSGSKSASTTITMGITGLGAVSEQELIYTFEITELTHRYTISPSAGSIRMLIKDSNVGNPNIPVMRLSGPSSIAEGETANYTLTSSFTPTNAPVTVMVNIANNIGDFMVSGQGGDRTFSVSDTTPIPFSVATKVGTSATTDGSFTVKLVEGVGYALPSAANSRSITTKVTDPVITIDDLPSSVTQGHTFSFTVKATGVFTSAIPVRIRFNDPSASITSVTPAGVYIANGEGVLNIPATPSGSVGSSIQVTVNTTNPTNEDGEETGGVQIFQPNDCLHIIIKLLE